MTDDVDIAAAKLDPIEMLEAWKRLGKVESYAVVLSTEPPPPHIKTR